MAIKHNDINKNITIFVLALCYFFVFGLSNVSYFLSVFYAKSKTMTAREAGFVISAFYITSILSRPFLAYVLSNLGFRRSFAVAGITFVAGSAGMLTFGLSFWPSLISRGILGLASSLYKAGFLTYQALAFNRNERGRAYSLIMVGELLPLVTIMPVADMLIKLGVLEIYMWIPVFMSIAAGIAVCFLPKQSDMDKYFPAKPTISNPFRGMAECIGVRSFRLALLSTFLFSMADAIASFMSGMTASCGLMASFFLSSNAFVGIIIRLFFTKSLDKFSTKNLASATVIITSGTVFMASINPSEFSLVILGAVFGIGMGFGFPLHLALVADCTPKNLQAQASAITWLVIGINFSVVPLLMGYLETQLGAVMTFRSISLIVLLGAGGLFLFRLLNEEIGHGSKFKNKSRLE